MNEMKRTLLSECGLQCHCTAGGTCNKAIVAAFPITREELARILAKAGWYLSVLSPPGAPGLVLMGPVCGKCAPKVYSPDLLKAAEEARLRLLATIEN